MEVINITSTLKTLMLQNEYTTICDDIKLVMVPVEDSEYGEMVQRKIEMTNPVDYTRDEIKKNFDLNTKVIKWDYSYTESGEPTTVVVLEKGTE